MNWKKGFRAVGWFWVIIFCVNLLVAGMALADKLLGIWGIVLYIGLLGSAWFFVLGADFIEFN